MGETNHAAAIAALTETIRLAEMRVAGKKRQIDDLTKEAKAQTRLAIEDSDLIEQCRHSIKILEEVKSDAQSQEVSSPGSAPRQSGSAQVAAEDNAGQVASGHAELPKSASASGMAKDRTRHGASRDSRPNR